MKEFIQNVIYKYNYYTSIKHGTRTENIIVGIIVFSWFALGLLNLYFLVQFSLYVFVYIICVISFFLLIIYDETNFTTIKAKQDYLGGFKVFHIVCSVVILLSISKHSAQICKFIYGGKLITYEYNEPGEEQYTSYYLETSNKNYPKIHSYIEWFMIIVLILSNWFIYKFKSNEIEELCKKEKYKEEVEEMRDWIYTKLKIPNKTE